MSTVFEPGKTYKMRNGQEREVIAIWRDKLVVAAINEGPTLKNLDGTWIFAKAGKPDRCDLMPPEPERIDRPVWVNVYLTGHNSIHFTAELAKACATSAAPRIAVPCRLIEIVGDAS